MEKNVAVVAVAANLNTLLFVAVVGVVVACVVVFVCLVSQFFHGDAASSLSSLSSS